ncbi:MAG TPA: C25 family cysteine peptidase, partial [Roseiflexaceae bacterium]|nr:C25 family cysteine peptidase [Roseiflexaceae bacterium]
YQDVGALRTALLTSWNHGAALVVYAGHASPWQWGWTGPNEAAAHLFHLYDADSLGNGERLPIVLSLTCRSGDVFNPTLQATDERLLLRREGGIAAALSPVGSGVNRGHTLFGSAVVAALVHGATLGAAHQAGLEALARSEHDLDLAFGYQLLGDPDLSLPGAMDRTLFLPLITR